MDFKSKFKKIKFKKKSQKKPRDGSEWKISAPGKKAILSAGAVLMAGGLLAAGVLNMNTCAYTSSFLSDSSGSRKITDTNYDYKKAGKHLIVRSAESLKESDGYKKIADGLYLVDKDTELDGDITVYEDGDVVIADAEGADKSEDASQNEDVSADTGDESNVSEDVQEEIGNNEVSNNEADVLEDDADETEANESTEEAVENTENTDENVLKTDTTSDESGISADSSSKNSNKSSKNDKDSEQTKKATAANEEKLQENALADYINSIPFTKEVKVAVLDTGVSADGDRILDGKNFSATGKGTADDNGHGSSISKLILNNTSDLVKILPVKVMDSTGHGTLLSLYQGIEYAIEQKVDIINISLATAAKDTTLIQSAISDAENAGIKVIAAAGNDDMNAGYYAPANIDSVITVAAVDDKNNRAGYSNYGNVIDYAACGDFDGNKGTSFSAAYVTAAVADLLSGDKDADVEKIFDDLAYKPEGLKEKYRGQGIVSLDKVIAKTEKQYQEDELKDFDNWKNMSGDKFDKLLKETNIYKVACFWQHLSDTDKKFAKNLTKGQLTKSTVRCADGTTKNYIEFLESVDFNHTSLAAFTTTNGCCYIYVYEDGQHVDDITILIHIDANEDVYQNHVYGGWPGAHNGATYIVNGGKQKYFSKYNLNSDMQWDREDGLYSKVHFAPYFKNSTKVLKDISSANALCWEKTQGNFVNGKYSASQWSGEIGFTIRASFYSDFGMKTNQPGGNAATSTAFSFNVSNSARTVDINPQMEGQDGKMHDGGDSYATNGENNLGGLGKGCGFSDLTFDVYEDDTLLKSKVNDFYGDIGYNKTLKITAISTPTGYHATEETYTFKITENKTDDNAIIAPKIVRNKYDVSYESNVPDNAMTKKNKCTGSTDALKGCTWGVENEVSSCGYNLPGYEFVSWNTSADGTGTTYNPGDKFTKLSDKNGDTVYLYAQWKKLDYTISFDLNGGKGTTPKSITKAYGDNVSMPSDTNFKKDDKVFIGWSTDKNDVQKCIQSIYSGFSYKKADESGEIYMSSPGNMTLYALYTIPVSDVASVQLRVWQKDNTSKLYTSGPISFGNAKNGYRELSFDNKGVRKLVSLMKSAGGKYVASSDGKACNLSADIVAKDNAGNEGIIWKLNVSGKEVPPSEKYGIKTEHQYKDINSNDGKGNYKYDIDCITDAQTVLKNTKYTPKYLSSDSSAAQKIRSGYEPEKMSMVINGQSSMIMNGTNAVTGKVPVTITSNTKFIAYYTPKQYKIHFKTADGEAFIKNANADNTKSRAHLYIDNKMRTMNIYYTEKISELPSASKTGYTFTGWKILKEDNKTSSGVTLNVGDKYEYTRDITVVPSWEINSYTIKYDAATNGGSLTATSTDSDTVKYGETVTVNKTIHNAERVINKGGTNERKYVFVGWNTDPGAKSVKGGTFEDGANVLSNGKMPAKDITVYAIYKRTVTAKFYGAYSTDKNKPDALARYGKCVSTQSVTYYNNDTFGTVTAPDPTSAQENLDWTFRGWSLGNTYDSSIVAAKGSNINIDTDTSFYGLYQKDVTLTYISNCDAKIDPVNGTAYYNAAPEDAASVEKAKKNVTGTFDGSLKSNEANSYVGWVKVTPAPNCTKCQNPTEDSIIGTMDKTKNGCKCKCFYPNSGLKNKHQTGCTCCFMPGEAYSIDRDTVVAARWDAYPVISAKDTYISSKEKSNFEAKLLASAESMDNEDVTTPISVQNKDEINEIINSTDENVDVTVIYKTIDSYGNVTTESKILHVVNTASKDAANTSYARFINQKAKNASYNLGGLEKNSLWVTKQSYTDTLNKALANAESVKNVKANSSNAYTVNGKTYKPQYVLKYTNSDIKSVKQYLKNNGYGKFQKSTNMSSGSSVLNSYYNTYVKGHKK